MPKKRHPEIVPLVKRRGSPRPGADDPMSLEVFGSGHRADWHAERWAAWLDDTDHEADAELETLLRACPRQPLLTGLLVLYTLPVGRPTTRALLRKTQREIAAGQRALVRLSQLPLAWLDGSGLAPAGLWLDLAGVNMQLAPLVRAAEGTRVEDLAETHLMARLTALVRAATGQWHDRELAALVSVFLGRTFSDGAKARAEWRRRNRPLVRSYLSTLRQAVRKLRERP